MCLIGIRIDDDGGLGIAANRDEFADRPTQPMHWWPQGILAGRDLRAGGTWFGLTRNGRFAAVTNVRDPALSDRSSPQESRGLLVTRYLLSETDPESYVQDCLKSLSTAAPFNLILGQLRNTRTECWWLGGRVRRAEPLSAGVHVLSNAELNTPWPKAVRLATALRSTDLKEAEHVLLSREHAHDHELPATGVSYEWEKRLSAALITGDSYHTRSTTLLYAKNGRAQVREMSWSPHGDPLGEYAEEFALVSPSRVF